MSKKVIKNRKRRCTQCGKQRENIMLTTMPGVVRKRTKAEKEAEKKRIDDRRSLTREQYIRDLLNRKVRLCPVCVKKAIEELAATKQAAAKEWRERNIGTASTPTEEV